jgi:hypothetical protein
MYTFPDGKIYIGQTRRMPEKRKREHVDSFTGPANSGFWEAYKRFGKYEYKELYIAENDNVDELVTELNIVETRFIQLLRANNPQYGYNKASFATVGTKTNVILKEKLRERVEELLDIRMKVYENAVNKIWHTKDSLSQEEIQLVTSKYCDQNIWYEHIEGYDFRNLKNNKDDEKTEFYLEEYLGYIQSLIIGEAEFDARCYIAENYDKILRDERCKNAIVQLDKEGNVVKEFYSFNEICQAFNVPRADNVKNVLKGKQKSAYGYFWKYKEEM